MDVPADLPAPLTEVLALSDRLDGASVIYTPEDRIAYVSPAFRRHYAFCELDSATYDQIFWACVRQGLYGATEMRMDPAEYLAVAKVVRRVNEQFDFVKQYNHSAMLGHHRAADGWSIQVRLPVDSPLWRGGFAGVRPGTLAEAAGAADATRSMRRALDALSTGMLFIHRDGAMLWANAAAEQCLAGLRGVTLTDGRLVFEDADLATDFAGALSGVLCGAARTRKFLALPTDDGGATICSLLPHTSDEAILLLAPNLDDDSLTAALRGFGLSPAETKVALLIAEGHKPQVVADRIGKSVNTVRAQLASVFKKAGDDAPASRAGVSSLIYRIAAVAGARRRH